MESFTTQMALNTDMKISDDDGIINT